MKAVCDRNLSLWQSVVKEMTDQMAKTDPDKAIQEAVDTHVIAAAAGNEVAPPAAPTPCQQQPDSHGLA